jgi:anti-sigma B factor antagonist
MEISTYAHEEIMVLELSGEVDAATSQDLGKTLKDMLDQGCHRIVIDISKMTFISSAGIRTLLYSHREADQLGGALRLVAPTDQVQRVFEITGVSELIKITNDLQETFEEWSSG